MNKKLLMGGGVLVIIAAMYFMFGGSTGNVIAEDGAQKITIDMKDWTYSPSVLRVNADVPVRIYMSPNVGGCYRDLILPEMNMGKYFATSEDYLEVTFPKGTYTFACSMYMGQGKIIAE